MDLNQIRCFLALAACLNFTKAAENCGVSQPTMSRAIKSLEGELGGELVRRERGKTHLTELGRMVRPELERVLAITEAVKADALDFSGLSTATLKLGVMCTIGPSRLIPIISHLSTHVPQQNIELIEAVGPSIVEKLTDGEIDVALVGLPKYPDSVAISMLYEEPYVVVFPAGHRFEAMNAVPVTELHNEPYVERLNCEYVSHYSDLSGPFLVELDVRYKSEHEEWIQAMILAGMGCACMPEYMFILPGLLRRPLVEPEVMRTISIATMHGRRHAPAIDLFSRMCKDYFHKSTPVSA